MAAKGYTQKEIEDIEAALRTLDGVDHNKCPSTAAITITEVPTEEPATITAITAWVPAADQPTSITSLVPYDDDDDEPQIIQVRTVEEVEVEEETYEEWRKMDQALEAYAE